MSNCIFIASDKPLHEVKPSQDYPLHINLDTGTISDGGADDNYSFLPFDEVDLYCKKKYGAEFGKHIDVMLDESLMEKE